MQLTRFLMPLALASTLVAAAPAPKSESLVSADLNLNDLIRLSADVNFKNYLNQARDVEGAFEKRSPRFMPPGHGPGPVQVFSWRKAAVGAVQALGRLITGKKQNFDAGVGIDRRQVENLTESLGRFLQDMEAGKLHERRSNGFELRSL